MCLPTTLDSTYTQLTHSSVCQSALCSVPDCRPPASSFQPTPNHSSIFLISPSSCPSQKPRSHQRLSISPTWSWSPSDINAASYLRDSRLSKPLHSHCSDPAHTCCLAYCQVRFFAVPSGRKASQTFSAHSVNRLSFEPQLRYRVFQSPLLTICLAPQTHLWGSTSPMCESPHHRAPKQIYFFIFKPFGTLPDNH